MRNATLVSIIVCTLPNLARAQSSVIPDRQRILHIARSLIGTTEATGKNDGRQIDALLTTVGLEGTGAPYCAAFNRFCYDRAGLRDKGPRSALAASWVKSPTWTQKSQGSIPLPGDTWGIYFPSKKRIAHTGLVEKWGTSIITTIEANTSPDAVMGSEADRNGDGVWRKRRLKKQIHAVKNWLS